MVKSTSKTRARQRSKSRLKQRNPKGTSSPIPLGKGAFQMGPSIPQSVMDEFMKRELEKKKRPRR